MSSTQVNSFTLSEQYWLLGLSEDGKHTLQQKRGFQVGYLAAILSDLMQTGHLRQNRDQLEATDLSPEGLPAYLFKAYEKSKSGRGKFKNQTFQGWIKKLYPHWYSIQQEMIRHLEQSGTIRVIPSKFLMITYCKRYPMSDPSWKEERMEKIYQGIEGGGNIQFHDYMLTMLYRNARVAPLLFALDGQEATIFEEKIDRFLQETAEDPAIKAQLYGLKPKKKKKEEEDLEDGDLDFDDDFEIDFYEDTTHFFRYDGFQEVFDSTTDDLGGFSDSGDGGSSDGGGGDGGGD